MIATGVNVIESLLSITMVNTLLPQACGCGIVVNVRSIRGGVSGSNPGTGDVAAYI